LKNINKTTKIIYVPFATCKLLSDITTTCETVFRNTFHLECFAQCQNRKTHASLLHLQIYGR